MNDQLVLDIRNRHRLIRESLALATVLTLVFFGYAWMRFEWEPASIVSMVCATIIYAILFWRLTVANTFQSTRILMLLLWIYIVIGFLVFGVLDSVPIFFSAIIHVVTINLLLSRKYARLCGAFYLVALTIELATRVFGVPLSSLDTSLLTTPEPGSDMLYLSVFILLGYIIIRGLALAQQETQRTTRALAEANERLLANEKRLQAQVEERTSKLRESEEKNLAIIEALPDVMSRATVDGVYTDFRVPTDFPNRHLVAQDRVGRSFYDFIPKEQADFFVETIKHTIKTGERFTYEYKSEPIGMYVEARVTKVNDNEVMSILRDVTARRQAEIQLQQSEARNRALISAIPDVMARVTRTGDYLDFVASDDFPKFGKINLNRAGTNMKEHFSAELLEAHMRGISEALDTGSMVRLEYERPEIGMWLEARIMPSQEDEATVIIRDITPQMHDSQRLQTIIDAIPNAVVVWSHADPWTVLWANQIACQMVKTTPQKLIGTTWDLSSHLEEQSAGSELAEQISRQEAILNKDVRLNLPGIGPAWYRLSIIHLNYLGTDAFMLIAEDVNEQRRADDILQRVQKLDSLGVLAGGIAHDFNNLLTSIMAQTSIAERKAAMGKDIQHNLQKALSASKKASELIRQMLAFSGKGQFEIRTIDLAGIVKENLSFLHASLPKAAKITFVPCEQSAFISGDSSQVQQVLMNLILNSAQAIESRADGEIVVKINRIRHAGGVITRGYTAASLEAGMYAQLTVCDNGLGMDAETQSRIFEPFFTTKPQGHGLGLAAVVGIMRGHSGEIIVESTLGVGTEIQLLFPLVEQEMQTELTTSGAPIEESSHTYVLAIDDEPYILEVIEDVLTLIEQPVMIAVGGQQGVQTFADKRHRIGLVILDLSMPDMDGSEVFLKLRDIQPDIPVILCSGYSEQEATHKFIGQGLAGFLQKPFDVQQLIATVSQFSKETMSKPAYSPDNFEQVLTEPQRQ